MLNKELTVKLKIDAEGNVSNVVKGVTREVDKLDNQVKVVPASMNKMGVSIRKVGQIGAAAFAGWGLAEITSSVIASTREFQSLKASLVTVTGSADAAEKVFGQIQDFAETTPFKLSKVTDAFIKMQALGLSASEDSMRSYGDTASAMGKSLNQMVEAVADAATGEFERLKEFGIKSRSEGDNVTFTFKGVSTTVKKSAKEIEEYLIELGQANFSGGMIRQMETVGGKLTNMEDAWDKAFNALGEGAEPAINLAIDGMQSLASTVEMLSEYMDEAAYVAGIGLAGAVVAKTIPALYGMTAAITAAGVAGKGFIVTTKAMTVAALAFAATPLGIAAMAMGGAIAYFVSKEDEAKISTDELTASAKKLRLELSKDEIADRAKTLESYQQELDRLIDLKKQNASVDVLGIKQSDLESRIEELATFKDVLKETLTLVRGDVGLDLANEYAIANKTMLEERAKLEKTLFDLTATTKEKREKQLSLLSAENRQLQKRIWAIKDQSSAQKRYNKLLAEQNESMDLALDKAIAMEEALSQSWGQKQNEAYAQRVANQWDKDNAEFDAADAQDALLSQTLALANSADLVGDAWVRTGNKALDALGSMSAMIQKLMQSDKQYADQQVLINKMQWEDEEDKYTALIALDKARTKNSINGSMAMLDASVAMFEEGSNAQEVAHKLSLSMTAIELGMELQKQVAAMTTANTVNAANTSTALTGATASVASAGTGDPYTAPFRVAAMSVMMAGVLSQIGVSFGGSSAGASNVASLPQPDGSVLGSSDPSQSVSNVYDLMVDIEADQYIELRSINREMQSLNSNLTSFVSSLYRTGDLSGLADGYTASTVSNVPFNDLIEMTQSWLESIPIIGGIFGAANGLLNNIASSIFGSTKKSVSDYGLSVSSFALGDDLDLRSYQTIKKKTDGGWFGRSRTSYSTQYYDIAGESERLLNRVFDNLVEGMIGFGDVLNRNVSEQVMAFEVSIGNISTRGQTSAQIQESLNNAISAESDRLAYAIFPDLVDAYAQLNEGAFETLGRLSVEQAVVSDVVNMTNQRISDNAIALSQSLISIAGGLDALTTSATNYYDAFFTESEKSSRNQRFLTEALSAQNLVLPETREAYRALVEGLDLSTDAAQEQYVVLMDLSEKAAEYYDALESLQMDALNAQIERVQESINEYQQLHDALQSAYDTINNGRLIDSMSYMSAQSELFEALTSAQKGDLPSLNSIEDSLNVIAQNNVENYASLVDFERDQAITSNLISELMGYTDSALNVEDQMLIELQRQTDLLRGLDVVSNKTDGSHKDGLYSVPYDGYTATLHEGEAVIDARTISGLRQYGINTSNASNRALIDEIKALKSEVSLMREQLYNTGLAIAVSANKSSRLLERWDEDGSPEVRSESAYASR